MATNPFEFKKFHDLLVYGRPNYVPFYFRLAKLGKDPDVRGSWKESRLSFEQAQDFMKLGFNIGIAGTDADDLVIVDLDRPGIEDVKPTLRVKSRKRQGWHNFYFTKDPRCKKNIPTEDHGEVRSSWQYVVACGSFVPLEQEKIDKLPPPERELAGCYTLENSVVPTEIIFDELPAVFKMQIYDQENPAEEPDKKKVNFKSLLWKLTCKDIFKDAPSQHVRWASPFHESETGKNTSMSSQGLIHCWRHNVSLTAIQALAVLSGQMSCLDAGEGHAGSGAGPSKVDLKNKESVRKLWSFAKEKGYLPADDADPYEIEGKKEGKAKKTKEEEKKYTALRELGDLLYRQVHNDGKDMFARYDRKTGEVTYVDRIAKTEEYPVDKQKAGMGVTFPRRLIKYGTPAQLYERLKKRITYASSQTGHKNAIFALYLMYHGCLPPFRRKNLQLIPLGPAGTGKGRYAELALFLGDRARATTDIKTATAYRMNELLNGGLLILDEMPDEDEDLDRFVRGRYDPTSVQERILDATSKTEIAGFKIAGPTIITRRRGFLDDANADRGIILKCEKPKGIIPLELLDRSEDYDLQDMLAMFWTEHFGDENLLPTEEDLMYDPKLDTVDCRLMLAARYLMKLAKVINSQAEQDLQGFVAEQEILRKELKLTTAEGMVIRTIYEIIQQTMDGHTYIYESKDGHTKKVEDTLAVDYRKGKAVLSLTRTRVDAAEDDAKTRQVPISWTMISNRAGLGREEISKLVQPYGITQESVGDKNTRIRTIAIKVDELDIAFRTFLMDYDPKWKEGILRAEPRLLESYSLQPSTNSDIHIREDEELLKTEKVQPSVESNKISKDIEGGELVKAEKVEVSEKPKEISIQTREKIDAALQSLQALASPSKFEHEFEILKWAIQFINEQRKAGNKVAAFRLRREGRDQFPKFEESLYRIIDSFFVDIESVAKLIYDARH